MAVLVDTLKNQGWFDDNFDKGDRNAYYKGQSLK